MPTAVSGDIGLWLALITAGLGLAAALVTLSTNLVQLLSARRRAAKVKPEPSPLAAPPQLEPASRGNSLPSPPRPFINRDVELNEAISQICTEREAVLAIEGPPGIGKSATATQLAHLLSEEPPRGPLDLREHAFVWVAGREGSTTLADIGRSLCIETDDQSVATGSHRVKLDRLRTHLASRRTALVLDNLRLSDDDDSETMRELLRTVPEGSVVIAAVTRPTGLDAYCLPLEELSREDVRKLIDSQVGRLKLEPRDEFDEEFAKRLYEIVGGHPATIRWFLIAYKNSGDTLDDRLEALRRGRDLPRLFEPVWSNLSADARGLLAACDCLGGHATAAQLAIACDIPAKQARAQATELRDEGLLGVARSAGRSAFTCPQAFRLFVFGETPVDVRYAYLQRLARHYIEAFESAPEDARSAIPEVDAIRAVFEGLARQELDGFVRPDLEDDLQRLFKRTLDILLTLGLFDDRLDAAKHAYDSAMRTRDYACASLAAHVLAGTHGFRGEFKAAEEALALGWRAAMDSGDTKEIARQMYTEGFLRYRAGRAPEALDVIEGAEERLLAANDLEWLVNVLDMQSAALLYLGRLDECDSASLRCLDICEKIGWERAKAFPLRFRAEVAIHRGAMTEARGLLERAQRITSAYHDQRQSARVSLTTARLHLLAGELDAGEPIAAHAVAETTRLGLPPEEEEARALLDAIRLARRSPDLLRDYMSRRPTRLTDAPVAGD
ncbi:MAG TPA: AAA family ATPase [Solirubrobacteraceae bacterium]|jgi:tetratricopeptide (TPR) repeat protein|nr:AAA family ATPase [Solirubrobacteraceae bacterium]